MSIQKNVLEYLEESAKEYPEKTAFSDESRALTFSELKSGAEALGTRIALTVGRTNRPIAVFVDRTVAPLVGFMGALFSGNYYVPIDSEMPQKRIEAILDQLKPALILCEDPSVAEAFSAFCPAIPVFSDDMTIDEKLLLDCRNRVLDIDPVYVIFTSGSTGTPKGIVISHRSAIDFVEWMADTCGFSDEDVMGNQAPFYFDLSVKDIYLTLKCGATTHIIPKKLFMFPLKLIEYLKEKKVTALVWATSAFVLVANSGALSKTAPASLNKVVLGGEALHAKHLNIWRAALPDVKYINLYGPTEVTVDCTYYIVDRPYSDGESIPIGRAQENMEILLLDEQLRPVEAGQPGEICVRGIGLAIGYYGDFEKTAGAFVQNPANTNFRDIIYRTGDMGYLNEEGNIVFLSRKDGQIKHMGYRIELGELETAICGLPEIRAAACFFDGERDKIVCVYEGDMDSGGLIGALRKSLPKYMFPNVIDRVDKMPYNANGKIDRVKLKENYYSGTDREP